MVFANPETSVAFGVSSQPAPPARRASRASEGSGIGEQPSSKLGSWLSTSQRGGPDGWTKL